MQASQSNNASDLLTLGLNADPKPEANLSRGFPSPFSAPIQAVRGYAARRSIERQKGDVGQAEHRARETADQAAFQAGDARDEGRRERDRRLERSLYEGHSIEAGLSFEGTRGNDPAGPVTAERASLGESDGSESLFRYAVAGPLPDPEVVRGAILRLARESELGPEPRVSPVGNPGEAGGAAALESSAAGQAQPLSFGDVARRVWNSGVAQTESRSAADPEPIHALDAASSAIKSVTGRGEDVQEPSFLQGVPFRTVPNRNESGTMAAEPARVADWQSVQPASSQAVITREPESVSAVRTTSAALTASAGLVCDVEGLSALAHDACNLLSALTLYSELLGSPGVLDERYRHYAEELKLLAVRSRVLIDRLLRGDASRERDAPSGEVFVAAPAAVEASAEIPIQGAGDADAGSVDQHEASNLPRMDAGLSSLEFQPIRAVSQSQTGAMREEVEQVEMATSTSENLATDSRVETQEPATVQGTVGQNAEGTDLANLLMQWGTLLSTMAHGSLEVELGPLCATPVPAGAEDLERILVNLVRNAKTAIAAGGAIRISLGVEETRVRSEQDEEAPAPTLETMDRSLGGRARGAGTRDVMVLTVDDSGCGMTESQVWRILGEDACSAEPGLLRNVIGEAGDRRSPGNEGTGHQACLDANPGPTLANHHVQRRGLGLQIVRELVATSGGTLSIQSWPGRGTRIQIRWPVSAGAAVEAAEADRAEAQVAAAPTLRAVKPMVAIASAAVSIATPAETSAPTSALRAMGSPPVEITQGKVGPDGFSESELRAMMLRLHRSGPLERSPLSRRLNNRPTEVRATERGFGAAGKAIHSVPDCGVQDCGVPDYGVPDYGVQRDNSAQQVTAAKGAIAC